MRRRRRRRPAACAAAVQRRETLQLQSQIMPFFFNSRSKHGAV